MEEQPSNPTDRFDKKTKRERNSWVTDTDKTRIAALLESSEPPPPLNLKAFFLGPKAENADLVEQMLVKVFRDYVFWRRNFHPEDQAAILPEDQRSLSYERFLNRLEGELFTLLGELKSDIPYYSPRYIGHMISDYSLPALIGYIAALLYNPNNVTWEVSPVTTLLEIEVGRELAGMLGFGKTREELAETWGHITSGGTIANMESIWIAKAVKFLPIAVKLAAAELEVTNLKVGSDGKPLESLTNWELVNLLPREALNLKEMFILRHIAMHPEIPAEQALIQAIEYLSQNEILSLGDYAFFSRFPNNQTLKPAIILAPQTMHYSWAKLPGAIGIGSHNVVPVQTDANYRMDISHLRQKLEWALEEQVPVIAVVGVVGATEEGAVDPVHELIDLRQEFTRLGLSFSLHCDAAYGGYFMACFRLEDGELRDINQMQNEYAGWPSEDVYKSYTALKDVESVTIDPHKLGFVPYPAGAIIFRDGRVKDLVAQEAVYALGGKIVKNPGEIYIGKYILEGSKPGAAAAATFLSHKVVPPNETGYGAVLGYMLCITRAFSDRLEVFAEKVRDEFIIKTLVQPDTNIVIYAINPAENDRLDVMNRFGNMLYRELSIDPSRPVQSRSFIVSHTELSYEVYNPPTLVNFLGELGVSGLYLVSSAELSRKREVGKKGYANAVVVFRTTLMNPFTLQPAHGNKDYIDLFFETLLPLLRKTRKMLEIRVPYRIQAELKNLAEIRNYIRKQATILDVDHTAINDMLIAVDEAATNIITHSYKEQGGIIEIEVRREGDAFIVHLRDEALPFDPTAIPQLDLSLPAEERIMGDLGISLMRRRADEISHRITLRRGNELTLVKREG